MTYEEAKCLQHGTPIMCNTYGKYAITIPNVMCSFIKLAGTENMFVKVEEGEFRGSSYPVWIKDFDVVVKVAEIEESELADLFA